MVVVGPTSPTSSPTEFSVNAELAANLETPHALVVSGADREPEDIATAARVAITDARAHHAHVLAVVANRVTADPDSALGRRRGRRSGHPAFAVPDSPFCGRRPCGNSSPPSTAPLLYGDPTCLDETCQGLVVAAMTMPHVLDRLVAGGAVVVPGDREDVVPRRALAHEANTFPHPGRALPQRRFRSPQVQRLIDGLSPQLPVIGCAGGNDGDHLDPGRRSRLSRSRLPAQTSKRQNDFSLSTSIRKRC